MLIETYEPEIGQVAVAEPEKLIVAHLSDGNFHQYTGGNAGFFEQLFMKFLRVRRDFRHERATQDAAEVIQAYVDLAGLLPAGTRGCEAYGRAALAAFENWRDQALRAGQLQQADEQRLLEILAQDH